MATDPFQLYSVIAQIAAAFAGFGSIASGLGHRRGGDDTRMDAQRLSTMLFASLFATLFGLLPATLAGLALGERWALGASAIVALVAIIAYARIAGPRARRLWRVKGFSLTATAANGACVVIATGAFALCALGLPAERQAGIYLLGLMAMLGSSVIMFSRVIASMLRPHSGA